MAEKTRYLTFNIVVWIIDAEHIGPIRDEGLVKSAIERPATTILGSDAYLDIAQKAAALRNSETDHHAPQRRYCIFRRFHR
jgi:death-on-curing protein